MKTTDFVHWIVRETTMFICGFLAACMLIPAANAQFGQGGGFGQGGFGGQFGGQGPGGGGGQFPGGIAISPEGVISHPQAQRVNMKLAQKKMQEIAHQHLPGDLSMVSKLRKVSLNRLEAACQEYVDAGKDIPTECWYLAGLTRIDYIVADPVHGDLLLCGPAEPFAPWLNGRVIGTESGRPVITLDDLLVMFRLRSFNNTLGCSFDPDPQRLAETNRVSNANTAPVTPAVARQNFHNLARILGNWNVTVFGLPKDSQAALTTVEADYLLKRIALGIDRPRVRGFRSHLETVSLNDTSFSRWWFAPRYDVIERSPDGNIFHISGPRLQLMAQEELVDEAGNRSASPFEAVSVKKYTTQFNKHIEALCEQVPSFAGIQNLFDLAITAALIDANRLTDRVGWTPRLFVDAKTLPTRRYVVPKEVPSMANTRAVNAGRMLALIGGGVTIRPAQMLSRTDVLAESDQPEVRRPEDASWWWD